MLKRNAYVHNNLLLMCELITKGAQIKLLDYVKRKKIIVVNKKHTNKLSLYHDNKRQV